MEFSIICTDLGNIDMKLANRVGFEFLFRFGLSLHIRQAGDTMALVKAMQAGAGETRNAVMERVKAIVQW